LDIEWTTGYLPIMVSKPDGLTVTRCTGQTDVISGRLCPDNRLITHRGKKSHRRSGFGAVRSGSYARYANYAGYAMYAGYEDFPSPDEFK
jgi:hypothetical protein